MYSKYNPETGGCQGFKKNNINTQSQAWVLDDGSILFTYSNGSAPVFAVDINGFKGPNKGGFDLFVFSIHKNQDAIYFSDRCDYLRDTKGKSWKNMLLN